MAPHVLLHSTTCNGQINIHHFHFLKFLSNLRNIIIPTNTSGYAEITKCCAFSSSIESPVCIIVVLSDAIPSVFFSNTGAGLWNIASFMVPRMTSPFVTWWNQVSFCDSSPCHKWLRVRMGDVSYSVFPQLNASFKLMTLSNRLWSLKQHEK